MLFPGSLAEHRASVGEEEEERPSWEGLGRQGPFFPNKTKKGEEKRTLAAGRCKSSAFLSTENAESAHRGEAASRLPPPPRLAGTGPSQGQGTSITVQTGCSGSGSCSGPCLLLLSSLGGSCV
jgi:hypothetical protein